MKFAIQVAALASQDKVTELQEKLSNAGFKSYVQRCQMHPAGVFA